MRPANHFNRRKQIHDLLSKHPDGLTRHAIQETLNMSPDQFTNSVRKLPHVYIDRWQARQYRHSNNGIITRWVAVYCMVDVPPNAPMPDRPATEDDMI